MKTYKKIHESKEVADIHIAKILQNGGTVKKYIKDKKTIVEYYYGDIYRVKDVIVGGDLVGYKLVNQNNECFSEVNKNERYRLDEQCKLWNKLKV
jgi:hypothetical protein